MTDKLWTLTAPEGTQFSARSPQGCLALEIETRGEQRAGLGLSDVLDEGTSLEGVLVGLGFIAGALTRPELFTALAESLQCDGGLRPGHLVFVRDTLTRVLQLAGIEPLE